MTAHSVEEIKKETRIYILVFVALAALTMITVAVSYLDLTPGAAVALALFIAAVKGSLVAAFFMHLISERKLIYAVLILTAYSLLRKNPRPSRAEIIEGMDDNLCRCGAHSRIVQAIQVASEEMKGRS